MLKSRTLYIFLIISLVLTYLLAKARYTDLLTYSLTQRTFIYNEVLESESQISSLLFENFNCGFKEASTSCFLSYRLYILALLALGLTNIFIFTRYIGRFRKRVILILIVASNLYLLFLTYLIAVTSEIYLIEELSNQANGDLSSYIQEVRKGDFVKTNPNFSLLDLSKDIEIIDVNPKEEGFLEYAGVELNEENTLYKSVVLPWYAYSAHSYPLIDSLSFEIILIGNRVIVVNSISKESLDFIAPKLVKSVITKNYPEVLLEQNVEFFILDVEEYNKVLNKEIDEAKAEAHKTISNINYKISQVNDAIANNNEIINNLQNNLNELDEVYEEWKEEVENEYDYYCSGIYYSQNRSWCEKTRDVIDEGKDQAEKDKQNLIKDANLARQYNAEWALTLNEYHSYLKSLQDYLEQIEKDPVTPELQAGVTYSEGGIKKIYIKYYGSKEHLFSYYTHVALHEYLHILSNSDGGGWPTGLTEGMTDYLADELNNGILKYRYKPGDLIGYQNEVEILKDILEDVNEDRFIHMYFFDMSEETLEDFIEGAYQNLDYDKFSILIDEIYYSQQLNSNNLLDIL